MWMQASLDNYFKHNIGRWAFLPLERYVGVRYDLAEELRTITDITNVVQRTTGLGDPINLHRVFACVMRPALSVVLGAPPKSDCRLTRAIESFDREAGRLWQGLPLAA